MSTHNICSPGEKKRKNINTFRLKAPFLKLCQVYVHYNTWQAKTVVHKEHAGAMRAVTVRFSVCCTIYCCPGTYIMKTSHTFQTGWSHPADVNGWLDIRCSDLRKRLQGPVVVDPEQPVRALTHSLLIVYVY